MSNQATKLIFWHEVEAKLPADALHCEYIESTMDSQFINTGILVSQKLQIYLRAQFASFSGNESWLFGCWNNGHGYPYDARSYLIGFFQQYLRAEVGPDNSQYWATVSRDTGIHDYAMVKDGSYIDGVLLADADFYNMPTYERVPSQMMLFKSPHVNAACIKRIYAFQAFDQEDKLVMNLIPGFSTNEQKAGFYDSVGKKWLFGDSTSMGYKLS